MYQTSRLIVWYEEKNHCCLFLFPSHLFSVSFFPHLITLIYFSGLQTPFPQPRGIVLNILIKKQENLKIWNWQTSSGHLHGIRFKKRYFLGFSVTWFHGLLLTRHFVNVIYNADIWYDKGGISALVKGHCWLLCPFGRDYVRTPPNTWAKNDYSSFIHNEIESQRHWVTCPSWGAENGRCPSDFRFWIHCTLPLWLQWLYLLWNHRQSPCQAYAPHARVGTLPHTRRRPRVHCKGDLHSITVSCSSWSSSIPVTLCTCMLFTMGVKMNSHALIFSVLEDVKGSLPFFIVTSNLWQWVLMFTDTELANEIGLLDEDLSLTF